MKHLQTNDRRLIKCKIQVIDGQGKSHIYPGLFRTTIDAVNDALDRYGPVAVTVKANRSATI